MTLSDIKIIDFDALRRALEAAPEVAFAYVFGSAQDGTLPSSRSDVDIAVYCTTKHDFDLVTRLTGICQVALQMENVDLVFLNQIENPVLAMEVLKGRQLFVADDDLYATFFSLTCRYYEADCYRRERFHQMVRELDG